MTYTPKTKPMAHQIIGLEKSIRKRPFAFLMEFGTGKSWLDVTTTGMLWEAGEIDSAVQIAPRGNYEDWTLRNPETSHFSQHMDPAVLERTRVVQWRGGHTRSELDALEKLATWSGLAVLTVNVEALSAGDRALRAVRWFMERRKRVKMTVDESTTIKTHNSARTKNVLSLASLAYVRRILTGEPAPNGPLDLYSQFEFLDWRILKQRSFYGYRARYAITEETDFGGRAKKPTEVVVAYRNTTELNGMIEPYSYRVRADDCLDLPPRQWHPWQVDLTKEQRQAYDEMRAFASTKLSALDYVTATVVIVQMLRLHQITCGFVTTDDKREVPIKSNRLGELLKCLEVSGERKTVIWAFYTYNIREIQKALSETYGPRSVVTYYGGTSNAARAEAKARFASDPECMFFLGNQSTGGRGLNDLVVARHAIYYSNTHDLELRLNSEARTRRKGSEQHRSVVYTDMIVPGSVESRIIKALREKLTLASVINGDNWREWLI